MEVLHIGCGPESLKLRKTPFSGTDPYWTETRLDIDPEVNPDIVADMTDMSMVEDESYDGLYSSHNIEHLFFHKVSVALNEFYRVLKVGGLAHIEVPDIQKVCEFVSEGEMLAPVYNSGMGPISPIDIMYGHRASIEKGNEFMAHKTGYTQKSLTIFLEDAGFLDVNVERRGFDLIASGYRRK